jgi:uncharacterized protein with NRDE domain
MDDQFSLLVAANRDEFYDRPTAVADFWVDSPGLFAGRDQRAGGTWLGISRSGRFAAVTNFRDTQAQTAQENILSRGELPPDFLRSASSPEQFLDDLLKRQHRYTGFNLLIGDRNSLWYFSNRESLPRQLKPGIYGLSNHLLDTPWPKLCLARERMSKLINTEVAPEALLHTVSDRQTHEVDNPRVGFNSQMESLLSAQFVVTETYGTRASTALRVNRNGKADLVEQNFVAGGLKSERRVFEITLD